MPEHKICVSCRRTDKSEVNNTPPAEDGRVPPRERRRQALEFIEEHDMPLPPLAIFAGMKRQYRATFSYRTVQNILSDLVEQNEVFRVDTTQLRDGVISEVEDDGRRRTYYFITDEGRKRLESVKPKH